MFANLWTLGHEAVRAIYSVVDVRRVNTTYEDLRSPPKAFEALLEEATHRSLLKTEQAKRLQKVMSYLMGTEFLEFYFADYNFDEEPKLQCKTYDLYHTIGHNITAAVVVSLIALTEEGQLVGNDLETAILAALVHDTNPVVLCNNHNEAKEANHISPSDATLQEVWDKFYGENYNGEIKQEDIQLITAATEYGNLPFFVHFEDGYIVCDGRKLENLLIEVMIIADWLSQTIMPKLKTRKERAKALNTRKGKPDLPENAIPPGVVTSVIFSLDSVRSHFWILFANQISSFLAHYSEFIPQVQEVFGIEGLPAEERAEELLRMIRHDHTRFKWALNELLKSRLSLSEALVVLPIPCTPPEPSATMATCIPEQNPNPNPTSNQRHSSPPSSHPAYPQVFQA